MSRTRLLIMTLFMLAGQCGTAQTDSVFNRLEDIQKISIKYLDAVENKIDKYSNRISVKTEKTLTKLSRWENKIKNILDRVSPETSTKLFGSNATTFTSLLKKLQEGKTIAEGYRTKYNEYRDKLTTSVKYLEDQKDKLDKKFVQPISNTKKKLDELERELGNTEAIETFIKERKKQLLNEAVKYVGKSKYLTKIDKESYYYIETLRNYRELFTDKKKAEEVALKILNKIPAFQKFFRENGRLASLFGSSNNNTASQSLGGMQTRASVQALIRDRIASGGASAAQFVSQNMQLGRDEFSNLKNKIAKAGGHSSDDNIPNFKPNSQKSKTFLQRLEMGCNVQFAKNNTLVPTTADIALSLAYKLNDRSAIGIGAGYKMGLGSIDRISITHQGISIRSSVDWKLKKQFFITGGFEMNYNAQFKNFSQLQSYNNWQQSGLVGLTKKLNIKTKLTRGTSVQLLYDFLYNQHNPVTQPVLFRVGYNFK